MQTCRFATGRSMRRKSPRSRPACSAANWWTSLSRCSRFATRPLCSSSAHTDSPLCNVPGAKYCLRPRPERLVFANALPYPTHLARLSLADLFLDTLPFNGGTTTSDALWAGVPVVTCAGKSFAGRMSGSLLRTIGMAELVTQSLEDYERLALRLATQPERLAEVRATLAQQRRITSLFNTERFCRHLEAAYAVMMERHRNGLAPATFRVSALPPA
jgi:Glycosyl transferase family 41